MVPKNGNKYRPIRIECAVCRLFGAVASDIARKIVGPGLQPIQTGGGLRCGVEFGARMADLAYRQEDAIIAVDIANAFNTVRHGPIFSAIMDRYSPIARFFRWKYGTSSEMRDYSGNIVAHTRTGVGQGDPGAASSLNSASRLPFSTCPDMLLKRRPHTTAHTGLSLFLDPATWLPTRMTPR